MTTKTRKPTTPTAIACHGINLEEEWSGVWALTIRGLNPKDMQMLAAEILQRTRPY